MGMMGAGAGASTSLFLFLSLSLSNNARKMGTRIYFSMIFLNFVSCMEHIATHIEKHIHSKHSKDLNWMF
jgi:TctA family transporter